MRSYWLWLLLNLIVWLLGIRYLNEEIMELTGSLIAMTCYFILFFILPLFLNKPKIVSLFLFMQAMIAMITFFPERDGGFNLYFILVLSLLIGEGFYRLTFRVGLLLGILSAIVLSLTAFQAEIAQSMQIFVVVCILIVLVGMIFYKKTIEHNQDLEARYEALLNEYRDVKRRVLSEEEATRQEERMLIAHEIHDSVGHKLSALMIQLEAFRLKAGEQDRDQVQFLKELAHESLEETRRAVKSLKVNEAGGLPGILRLIRKLETESFLRIHFSVKHGAFTAPLTGEQSFIIYRSVQEALTNVMKHSQAREAEISFEAPGGGIFRFEVSNPVTEYTHFEEGFGLTEMRRRLQKFGGALDTYMTREKFIVNGYLKIGYGGVE
ncbi:histidine kinase [Robertmurraya siralis]|uniref:histidine kinase n=1 Tax=Robertmurraya siralis TaxID=77777 RepID=A0A919WKR2_9BACI|nr:histidine kinase [Robertmurraya siralis]PAE19930.1 histidine kinase [Bacillus sp. 7504-2]GIN63404.1 histidine kinase [Robertmurraya siralis]